MSWGIGSGWVGEAGWVRKRRNGESGGCVCVVGSAAQRCLPLDCRAACGAVQYAL